MSKRRALRTRSPRQVAKPVVLYDLVFHSLTMRLVVVLMLSFFAFQPLTAVYANTVSETEEDVPASTDPLSQIDETAAPETNEVSSLVIEELDQPEMETHDESNETEAISEAVASTTPKSETDISESETTEVVDDQPLTSNPDIVAVASSSVVDAVATTTIDIPTEVLDDVASTTPTPTDVMADEPKPEPETAIEAEEPSEVIADEVSVVDESTNVIEAQSFVINDQNRYQFGVQDCVSVGEDAFYCSRSTTTNTVKTESGVYSEMDSDGDSEIYYSDDGATTKLTNNNTDDLAPYYDPESHTVVWHRLIDGRYQIVSFDLRAEKETILTNSSVNNMEPTRFGEYIVWQRWVNDNWDIVLYDGETEIMITETPAHDIAPAIRNGYIIWHTTNEQGEKILSVYEIATGYTSAIADSDGGHVENPRFVLVYDTAFENGDIITKQYDPTTGEIKPVGSFPAPLPPPVIPEPDSTGETRALITSKSSSRDENINDSDEPISKPAMGQNGTSTAATTTTTIINNTDVTDINLATSTPEVADFSLTEFDVIVPPYESPTNSLTNADTATSTES